MINNFKKLIPHEYETLATYVNKRIEEANFVSISTDSWTDINGKNIMNFIVHTPKPFLYSFEDISTESETGELVADHLIKIIEEIGPKKVACIITDNAKAMLKSWRLVENIYPWIQVLFDATFWMFLTIINQW